MGPHRVYSIDTEFMRTDTLYPILGLIQLNIAERIFLIDGFKLTLADFWPKLYQAKLNIFHACSEDLELIYHYHVNKGQAQPLLNVFDTQIGLAFLGQGAHMGYQQALQTTLNISIDKGESRSNWLARPLREAQLAYAANDVIYLSQLAAVLERDLKQQGLWQYCLEDCQSMAKDIATQAPAHLLYLEHGHFKHSRKQLMQIQQLLTWRYEYAQSANKPLGFILKNKVISELIERQPRNIGQLQNIRDLHPQVVREHGRHIIDLMHKLPSDEQWPLRLGRGYYHAQGEDLMTKCQELIVQVGQQLNIMPDILMRKRWLVLIFAVAAQQLTEQELPYWLTGWRYEMITRPLLALLKSEQAHLTELLAPLAER